MEHVGIIHVFNAIFRKSQIMFLYSKILVKNDLPKEFDLKEIDLKMTSVSAVAISQDSEHSHLQMENRLFI